MKSKNLLFTGLFFLSFASFSNSQNVPSYVPTNGLVAWLPFTGNAADSSGNSNTGTVNGALLTSDRNGNANKAYSFNGTSNYIAMPNGLSTAFSSGTMTAAAWVFFSTNASWSTIIKNWGSATTGAYHFGLNDLTQKLQVQITQSNGTTTAITAPTTITLNAWHHVAFTTDGSFIRLYQDGVEIAPAVSYNGTLKTSFLYTNIGAKASTTGTPASFAGYLNGKIDELGLWSNALTLQQIISLYNAGQPTGIVRTENLAAFSFFPNPANAFLSIHCNLVKPNASVKISDILGNEVLTEMLLSNNYQLSISHLRKGIYFLELQNGGEVAREKFFKE